MYNALTECSADEPAKNRSQRSRRVDLGRQRVHQARTQEQRERTRRLDSHYYYIPTYDNCARHLRIYVYLVYIYRYITGAAAAAHTVIPQHAHKIATSWLQCTRDRYRRKMSLASESAEEEETRLSRRRGRDRARRAAQSSQATKNCRRSETAEARERRDRDRRKKRLDSESAEEQETRLSSETLSK